LGPCTKLHDEETKQQYHDATRCPRKSDIEHEFIRFIQNMINEVERKIVKGKQRLDLMNSKLDQRPLSKQAEAVVNINDKIAKLVKEAEEAGIRGDVDQAVHLMGLCEKLKEDKEALIKQYESCGLNFSETQEKQMEVCETCGAFLIIGDAQSRIDDHLMGKQHIGFTRLRKALEDHKNNPQRELEDTRRSGSSSSRRERRESRDRDRRDDRRDERSKYR
jgi:LUC7 N_terminus